ncbi:MAG TPA: hypothetical protein VG387_08345 [Rhizomicrobium sp.]|jgi:hypothetical protein|nr:hypothetical protein [Rhizomicrobium sp.]
MLAGCAGIHLRVALPDAPSAVTAATKLCNWEPSGHLHAEVQGERWHVWDDRGNAQAFLNRYNDGDGTYFCVGL